MSDKPPKAVPRSMTVEELKALPVTVDLVTAGRAFGIGRTKAQQLAKSDEFPCRVLRLGNQYRVPTADLLRALGIEDEPVNVAKSA